MLSKFRVPPLALTVIMAVLMYFSRLYVSPFPIPEILKITLSLALLFGGCLFSVLGVGYFRKNKTTVDPTRPELATTLVTSGVYAITRNPMYVGFLLFLLSLGVYFANYLAMFMALIFFIYMSKVQIACEEKALDLLFGEDYREYKMRVRRWL